MKFPLFDYVRAASVAEAVERLTADEDARVLAGGQSLLPLMALRLARPTALVDIGSLDLQGVTTQSDGTTALSVGALTTHTDLLSDPLVRRAAPLLAAAAAHIGHPAIRNLGTVGGSVAHADPAAELPAALVALGAWAEVTGPAGSRRLPVAELVDGCFVNTLGPGELITAFSVPVSGPGTGAAWCEWAPRIGDFAEVGIGVSLTVGADGSTSTVQAATCGIGARPLDLADALAGSVGMAGDDPAVLRAVASMASEMVRAVGGDEDRSELAGLLAARALRRAYTDGRIKRETGATV